MQQVCFSISLETPSRIIDIAHFFADWQGTCLLYSGGNQDSARYSYLGLFPFETITGHGLQIQVSKGCHLENREVANPWDAVQELFFYPLSKKTEAISFGWFGYGMGAFSDQEKILPYRPSFLPDFFWQRCAIVLKMDQTTGVTDCQINMASIEELGNDAQDWVRSLSTATGWEKFLLSLPCFTCRYTSNVQDFILSKESSESYIQKIEDAQELIRDGEIYQINLSTEFKCSSQRHPFSFFRQLTQTNPAPFSVYFRYLDAAIVCTSPERFLSKTGEFLETRPIKGTLQRGKTVEEDHLLKSALLASPKEKAELLMITDLMRNDLGKISTVGSVRTDDIWRLEAYTNVFHLVSIIRSIAKKNLSPIELIRSCFPGGSITGCPKLRAMEVIDEMEKRPRGIYTGSIGYITGKGDFDLNIAIRTMVYRPEGIKDGEFSISLGSGIVIDSNPQLEFQEILFKGESLFQALQTEEDIV